MVSNKYKLIDDELCFISGGTDEDDYPLTESKRYKMGDRVEIKPASCFIPSKGKGTLYRCKYSKNNEKYYWLVFMDDEGGRPNEYGEDYFLRK